jgi:hypothetical protein
MEYRNDEKNSLFVFAVGFYNFASVYSLWDGKNRAVDDSRMFFMRSRQKDRDYP